MITDQEQINKIFKYPHQILAIEWYEADTDVLSIFERDIEINTKYYKLPAICISALMWSSRILSYYHKSSAISSSEQKYFESLAVACVTSLPLDRLSNQQLIDVIYEMQCLSTCLTSARNKIALDKLLLKFINEKDRRGDMSPASAKLRNLMDKHNSFQWVDVFDSSFRDLITQGADPTLCNSRGESLLIHFLRLYIYDRNDNVLDTLIFILDHIKPDYRDSQGYSLTEVVRKCSEETFLRNRDAYDDSPKRKRKIIQYLLEKKNCIWFKVIIWELKISN